MRSPAAWGAMRAVLRVAQCVAGRRPGCAEGQAGGRPAGPVDREPESPPRAVPGARGHGPRLSNRGWTTQRIAALIERRLGVDHHRNHVGKLLHQLGWSHQTPERRALERDDAAIAAWRRVVWPRVKKTPRGWGPTSSSSTRRAPPDPLGQQDVEPGGPDPDCAHGMRTTASRPSRASPSAPSASGIRCTASCTRTISRARRSRPSSATYCARSPATSSCCSTMAAFIAGSRAELLGRTSRLHLEPFPPYAPELNPDEGVWHHLKAHLANGRPDTSAELLDVLTEEVCRLAASPALLRGCIAHSDLPPFLP